jgi:hypothetical protein
MHVAVGSAAQAVVAAAVALLVGLLVALPAAWHELHPTALVHESSAFFCLLAADLATVLLAAHLTAVLAQMPPPWTLQNLQTQELQLLVGVGHDEQICPAQQSACRQEFVGRKHYLHQVFGQTAAAGSCQASVHHETAASCPG